MQSRISKGDLLLAATKANTTNEALALLHDNAPTESRNSEFYTSLHFAVKNNNPILTEALLKIGANRSCKTTNDVTPIALAASLEHWDCVVLFADYPVKPEYQYGEAIALAAQANKIDVIRAIGKNCPADDWDYYAGDSEYSALHWAVIHNNIPMITLLLEYGADPSVTDINNNTPLALASKLQQWDCVLVIAELVKVDKANQKGLSLILAAANNQTEVVEKLLSMNTRSRWYTWVNGYYALHWAVVHNNKTIIRLLYLHKKSDLELDKNKQTAPELAQTMNLASRNDVPIENVPVLSEADKDFFKSNLHLAFRYFSLPELISLMNEFTPAALEQAIVNAGKIDNKFLEKRKLDRVTIFALIQKINNLEVIIESQSLFQLPIILTENQFLQALEKLAPQNSLQLIGTINREHNYSILSQVAKYFSLSTFKITVSKFSKEILNEWLATSDLSEEYPKTNFHKLALWCNEDKFNYLLELLTFKTLASVETREYQTEGRPDFLFKDGNIPRRRKIQSLLTPKAYQGLMDSDKDIILLSQDARLQLVVFNYAKTRSISEQQSFYYKALRTNDPINKFFTATDSTLKIEKIRELFDKNNHQLKIEMDKAKDNEFLLQIFKKIYEKFTNTECNINIKELINNIDITSEAGVALALAKQIKLFIHQDEDSNYQPEFPNDITAIICNESKWETIVVELYPAFKQPLAKGLNTVKSQQAAVKIASMHSENATIPSTEDINYFIQNFVIAIPALVHKDIYFIINKSKACDLETIATNDADFIKIILKTQNQDIILNLFTKLTDTILIKLLKDNSYIRNKILQLGMNDVVIYLRTRFTELITNIFPIECLNFAASYLDDKTYQKLLMHFENIDFIPSLFKDTIASKSEAVFLLLLDKTNTNSLNQKLGEKSLTSNLKLSYFHELIYELTETAIAALLTKVNLETLAKIIMIDNALTDSSDPSYLSSIMKFRKLLHSNMINQLVQTAYPLIQNGTLEAKYYYFLTDYRQQLLDYVLALEPEEELAALTEIATSKNFERYFEELQYLDVIYARLAKINSITPAAVTSYKYESNATAPNRMFTPATVTHSLTNGSTHGNEYIKNQRL